MEAMSKCGACIVGSKATGFFVRSTISDQSTWDISVNYNDPNVFEFIDDMKAIGVTWITPKEEIYQLFSKGSGNITMDKFKYMHLFDYMKQLSNEMGYHLLNMANAPTAVGVTVYVSGDIVEVHEARFDNDSFIRESVWTCTGTIPFKSSVMTIRLSGERSRFMSYYPKAFVNAHSSCVQAIIGPYFSCHLYGRMTCDMRTYAWPNNVLSPPRLYDQQRNAPMSVCVERVPEWVHLSERGFKYERVSDEFMYGSVAR